MLTWIIPLASFLIAGEPSFDDTPVDTVEIAAFDCEKVMDDAETGHRIAKGDGISGWHNGGPAGSTWNAFELHCAVELETPCKKGTATVELRVGARAVRSTRIKFHPGQPLKFQDYHLVNTEWEKGLDPQHARYAFQVGIFRAIAYIDSCRDPSGPRAMFPRAEKSFTAGFAYGE
jgi:hypothetical protein